MIILSCFVRGEGLTDDDKRDNVSLKLTNLLDDLKFNLVDQDHQRGGIAIDTTIGNVKRAVSARAHEVYMQFPLTVSYFAKTARS